LTANRRSADFQSAVSQVFNLLAVPVASTALADCKSAIQQSATLRYGSAASGLTFAGGGDEDGFDEVFEFFAMALGALSFFLVVILNRHVRAELVAAFFAFVIVVWHKRRPRLKVYSSNRFSYLS
jgi:hypothetical protein